MCHHCIQVVYTSDTQLVERSGFLSLLQKGDEIMADRGFTIENLLIPLGVKLNIPPFLGERKEVRLLKLSRLLHYGSILNEQFVVLKNLTCCLV